MQQSERAAAMIELASRESGTLQVSLLWRQEVDVFTVSVNDAGTGDRFELVVEDRNPLDVYYHPYAYAALRGVDVEWRPDEDGLRQRGA